MNTKMEQQLSEYNNAIHKEGNEYNCVVQEKCIWYRKKYYNVLCLKADRIVEKKIIFKRKLVASKLHNIFLNDSSTSFTFSHAPSYSTELSIVKFRTVIICTEVAYIDMVQAWVDNFSRPNLEDKKKTRDFFCRCLKLMMKGLDWLLWKKMYPII